MAIEEELTLLIANILDWVERENVHLLKYQGVNLRGAMERALYFGAVHNLQTIRPLLHGADSWRRTADTESGRIYDSFLIQTNKISVISRTFAHLKGVAQLLWLAIQSSQKEREDTKTIGLFAYSDRFVIFYKDLIARLGNKRCQLISYPGMVDEANALTTGASLVKPQIERLRYSGVRMSPFHVLFPQYVIVLKSYLIAEGTLRHTRSRVLIFAEGTTVEDEVMARAAKKLAIPTIRIQSGRAGILHSGYRNMCFDKMLCWGDGFVQRFRPYSPSPAYLVTGSPFLDEAHHGYDKHTFTIFTQPISTYISMDDYWKLVSLAEEIVTHHHEIRLQIRKHPVDHAPYFDELASRFPAKVRMMNTDKYSLTETLASSSGAIGFYSTTLSEAAAYDVVPIILKLREQHSVFPHPEQYGAAVVARNNSEAMNWISRIMQEPELLEKMRKNMKLFAREFFGPQDGQAMKRTIDCILQTAQLEHQS